MCRSQEKIEEEDLLVLRIALMHQTQWLKDNIKKSRERYIVAVITAMALWLPEKEQTERGGKHLYGYFK